MSAKFVTTRVTTLEALGTQANAKHALARVRTITFFFNKFVFDICLPQKMVTSLCWNVIRWNAMNWFALWVKSWLWHKRTRMFVVQNKHAPRHVNANLNKNLNASKIRSCDLQTSITAQTLFAVSIYSQKALAIFLAKIFHDTIFDFIISFLRQKKYKHILVPKLFSKILWTCNNCSVAACVPKKQCKPIEKTIKQLQEGMELTIDTSGCCPREKLVCNPKNCKQLECAPLETEIVKGTEANCCPTQHCGNYFICYKIAWTLIFE